MQTFNEAGLPQPLFHRLEQMGFLTPTEIQAKAIPAALEGRDILGSAQTGTGKTGAYGIPLVTHLLNSNRGSALVLLPTRELALQVMQELKKFIGNSKIKTATLIGGEPMPKQFNQLRAKPRLIVGTAGRINDHLDRGTLMLHDTNFLVLDEVDRMLDMGFGIQLDAIARFLTGKRQTLMFSATLPDNIKKISAKYLTNPVRISVGSTVATAPKVKQESIKLSDQEKYQRLNDEIDKRAGSVLIFVKTKRNADRLAEKLQKSGHKTDALHGDLRQNKRTRVISNYRNQKFRILVATDVAARGLDIPHIQLVVNYDLPPNPEDYIHRIGRTARAGAEGEAINLISPADSLKWRDIQRLLDPTAKPDAIEPRGGRGKYKPKSSGQRRGKPSQHRGGGRPQGDNSSDGGKENRNAKPQHRRSKPKTANSNQNSSEGNRATDKPKNSRPTQNSNGKPPRPYKGKSSQPRRSNNKQAA